MGIQNSNSTYNIKLCSWEVIEFGDLTKKRRNDGKERKLLLLLVSLMNIQLRIRQYVNAKTLGSHFENFGGNEATKKTKKNTVEEHMELSLERV
ncbi:hypothetical protein Tco_1131015 [Tanacetum coccineum]